MTTKQINIIVRGAAGRMGRAVVEAVLADPQTRLVGALEMPGSPFLQTDAGLFAGSTPVGVLVAENPKEVLASHRGVIIDFTSPTVLLEGLSVAAQHQCPLVIGTTGLDDDEVEQIRDMAKKIPIVLAPNMSLGINLLYGLVAQVAGVLGEGYDIEILETHHKHKKDAPSGTAKKLAQVLCQATGRRFPDDLVTDRSVRVAPRLSKEIGVQVMRGGDVVGDHLVAFLGEGERIELKHMVTSRQTFARGALRAAKWLSQKKAGSLYSMQDVLGI